MDTKWQCPGQATIVVDKEAGVGEGNSGESAAKTTLEEDLSKRRTVPPMAGAGRAAGQGQSPVCSGGPGGGVKNEKNLTRGALAFIAVGVIDALGPVQTRSAGTVININLANGPGEACKGHRRTQGTGLARVRLHCDNDGREAWG